MLRRTFDAHVVRLYDSLVEIVEARYKDQGKDALHTALASIYANKSHKRIPEKLGPKRMTGWLVQSVIFTMRNKRKTEGLYMKRYKSITDLEGKRQFRQKVKMGFAIMDNIDAQPWEATTEEPAELIRDVQKAIGTLSSLHQNLVYAYFYEGLTFKEIAKRTGLNYFRVFTELEIAKACLRTELADYRR